MAFRNSQARFDMGGHSLLHMASATQVLQWAVKSSLPVAMGLMLASTSIHAKTTVKAPLQVAIVASTLVQDTGRTDLPDPPSTLMGRKMLISQAMSIAYAGGFQTEEQLVSAIAVAISESGLYTQARNWHPDRGFRPATDVISVKGPREAWWNGRQMHSDRGLWQIASFWYPEYSDVVSDNPQISAIIAFGLSKGGTDFNLWDSYRNNHAQLMFDRPVDGWPAVRPIVKNFLRTMRAGVVSTTPGSTGQMDNIEPSSVYTK